YRHATSTFEDDLARADAQLADAHDGLVAWRRLRAPLAPDWVTLTAARSPQLWERRPSDDDFLTLAAGVADRPSLLELRRPDGGEASLRARVDELVDRYAIDPAVPVEANLEQVRALGVVGEPAAADALVRALVVQAAAAHSPRDLAIVALVADGRDGAWR